MSSRRGASKYDLAGTEHYTTEDLIQNLIRGSSILYSRIKPLLLSLEKYPVVLWSN